jgi:cytochrome c oxidase subunit 1
MRRIANPLQYDFLNDVQPMNVMITHSAFVLGAAQLIFLFNFFYSMFKGKTAVANPWESNTLEWTVPSPIPYYNYEKIPVVHHGPYEYSMEQPGGTSDWRPQSDQGGTTGHG